MNIDKVLQKLRIDELNEMQQAACKTILGTQRDVVILAYGFRQNSCIPSAYSTSRRRK